MEAVGLVGALLGIIDKTARCISSLAEIQQRFKSANLTLELLTGQLFTVKAALSQLCDLIKESLVEEQHYQLTLDLDVGVYCCNLLTRLLEEQIVKLQYIDADELTFKSKVSLLLGSKGTDECLTRLDRQINALNLLITAFKFRTPKEQQILLEQKQSRKTFNQIKDDSSSLIVLCDSESSVTKRTKTSTATSKLSLNFVFDAALLQSKAYKSALRSLMRKAHRSGEPSDSSNSRQQTRKSYNSAPMHMIHADLDRSPGQFTVSHYTLRFSSTELMRQCIGITRGMEKIMGGTRDRTK